MALNTQVSIGIRADLTGSADLSTPRDLLNYSLSTALVSGTGSGQANKSFHDTRTLTSGGSEELDLAGGLTDAFGQTIALATVKVLFIRNKSSSRTLAVGGSASNGFSSWVGVASDTVKVPPSGALLLIAPGAGYSVVSGTGDLLKIANNTGSSCEYDIIIIGATVA